MDLAYKAALTATLVAMVLMVARLFGRQVAGLLAGLPIASAPALIWIALERGPAVAELAAVGSVAACPMAVVFALAYERSARRLGPLPTLLLATLLLALAAIGVRAWCNGMAAALGGAVAASVLALRLLPARPEGPVRVPVAASPAGIAATSIVAGLLSAVICAAGSHLDPFLGGMFASLPFVSAAVVVNEHVRGRPTAVARFLRGYIGGLLGKAVFGAAFGVLVGLADAGVAATLAIVVGVAASLASARWLDADGRRGHGVPFTEGAAEVVA